MSEGTDGLSGMRSTSSSRLGMPRMEPSVAIEPLPSLMSQKKTSFTAEFHRRSKQSNKYANLLCWSLEYALARV